MIKIRKSLSFRPGEVLALPAKRAYHLIPKARKNGRDREVLDSWRNYLKGLDVSFVILERRDPRGPYYSLVKEKRVDTKGRPI